MYRNIKSLYGFRGREKLTFPPVYMLMYQIKVLIWKKMYFWILST